MSLQCYAAGHDGDWEAICLDLDIAVQGESFNEVYRALNDAVELHVQAVMDLPEAERRRLLHRPAPLLTRLKWQVRYEIGRLLRYLRKGDSDDTHRHFTVPAHA